MIAFEVIAKWKGDQFFIVKSGYYSKVITYTAIFFLYISIDKVPEAPFIYFQF